MSRFAHAALGAVTTVSVAVTVSASQAQAQEGADLLNETFQGDSVDDPGFTPLRERVRSR